MISLAVFIAGFIWIFWDDPTFGVYARGMAYIIFLGLIIGLSGLIGHKILTRDDYTTMSYYDGEYTEDYNSIYSDDFHYENIPERNKYVGPYTDPWGFYGSIGLLEEIHQAIEEFEPPRRYENEELYHHTLFVYLKERFPDAKIEVKRGSSRPDIVIGDIAIEVKGPTTSEDLKTIADKLLRYPKHFEDVIVVLFDVRVNKRRYEEWLEGIRMRFPEVEIIKR